MSVNKVELCGVNTSKLPLLKEEEKEQLLERIQAGDEEARETYIKGNLRLVLSVIRRFESSSEISLISLTKIAIALDLENELEGLFEHVPFLSIEEIINGEDEKTEG